jgi:hypothetical protein
LFRGTTRLLTVLTAERTHGASTCILYVTYLLAGANVKVNPKWVSYVIKHEI